MTAVTCASLLLSCYLSLKIHARTRAHACILLQHCCFDYGNAEADAGDDGDGTMEALYFGSDIGWNREGKNGVNGLNTTGGPMDHGPWIGADIENGMYMGDDYIDWRKLPTWKLPYVTAMLKGRCARMHTHTHTEREREREREIHTYSLVQNSV